MTNRRSDCSAGHHSGPTVDRLLGWTPPRRDPTDLIFARQALDRQELEVAERHLRRALDADPDSAEVRSLMGVLHEKLGEYRAAYRCYRIALTSDRRNAIARAGLRRYCERFGFDFQDKAINPACEDLDD
jgi:tetratricopeptide (TPR) repeat protein